MEYLLTAVDDNHLENLLDATVGGQMPVAVDIRFSVKDNYRKFYEELKDDVKGV